jgi:hypothetical protein
MTHPAALISPCCVLTGLSCDLVDQDDFVPEWLTTLADIMRADAIWSEKPRNMRHLVGIGVLHWAP